MSDIPLLDKTKIPIIYSELDNEIHITGIKLDNVDEKVLNDYYEEIVLKYSDVLECLKKFNKGKLLLANRTCICECENCLTPNKVSGFYIIYNKEYYHIDCWKSMCFGVIPEDKEEIKK